MKIQIGGGLFLALSLSGCLTLSGFYTLMAVDEEGNNLRSNIHAEGRAIYAARNALCLSYPGATIKITNMETGKELTSESPYKCRNGRGKK